MYFRFVPLRARKYASGNATMTTIVETISDIFTDFQNSPR